MPIPIREDVAYVLLKKINEGGQGMHDISFTEADLQGRHLTLAELLGHLDYLNQKHFINAEFTGNAYGNQEDVPSAVNPQEFDLRIANTYGAPDGPLPHLIDIKRAELTDKGRKMLEKMEANPPKNPDERPSRPIDTKDMPFLEKVMVEGDLEDIFDARDVTEVVYRVMRDMMTTEAADRVADELHKEALPTDDKALQMEIADLWKDTNPLVGFISRFRPPLHENAGILKIDSDRFLFRVKNESGMARTGYDVDREKVVKAVFSATKQELSEERIKEVGSWLPEGRVQQLWQEA
jgi:uncharacterized protein (DUF2267 family)